MDQRGDPEPGAGLRSWSAVVGARVRQVRNGLGWSLERAARESGRRFRPATLSSYERGDRQITVDALYGLARLYQVPVHVLLPAYGREPVSDDRLVATLSYLPEDRRAVLIALVEQLADPQPGREALR